MPSLKKKHRQIDINDIHAKLESVRNEERDLGIGGAQGISDLNLFSLDRSGNDAIKKQIKTLNIDRVISSSSKTPGLTARSRPTSSSLKVISLANGKTSRISKHSWSLIQKMSDRRKKLAMVRGTDVAKTKRPKEKECVMDIWGSQSQKIKTKKELLGLEQKVERVATRGTVISGPVAVTTANALSYNPTHTEHQKLLDRALKEEVRIMEEAERINSMINPAEVSAEFFPTEEEEATNEISQNDGISLNSPVDPDSRKTQRQRNKQKRQALEARQMELALAKKTLRKQLNRVDEIEKEVLDTQTNTDVDLRPRSTADMRLGPQNENIEDIDARLEELQEKRRKGNSVTLQEEQSLNPTASTWLKQADHMKQLINTQPASQDLQPAVVSLEEIDSYVDDDFDTTADDKHAFIQSLEKENVDVAAMTRALDEDSIFADDSFKIAVIQKDDSDYTQPAGESDGAKTSLLDELSESLLSSATSTAEGNMRKGLSPDFDPEL
ncbi:MAG: hypothetical protein SGCHY_000262 [Lobulomycetales sp.]